MHDLLNTLRYLHALAVAALDDLATHINRKLNPTYTAPAT